MPSHQNPCESARIHHLIPFSSRKIKDLNLKNCGLKEFESIDAINLKTIDFSNNNLQTVNLNNIENLNNLLSFDLSDNEIKSVDNILLNAKLKILNLENNLIENLDDNIFQSANNLTKINLSNNKLNILPKSLDKLTNLKDLMVNYNFIKSINENLFKNCNKLKTISIKNN